MMKELTQIMTNEVEKSALVVSHNGAIFYFLQQVLPKKSELPLHLANGGFLRFSFDQRKFTYLETVNPTEEMAKYDQPLDNK